MRKTIVTIATLLGVAPAALAAGSPLPQLRPEQASGFPGSAAPQLRAEARTKLRAAERRARRSAERRRRPAHAKRARTRQPGAGSPQLEAIAQCESGGNPAAVGGGGQFRGKYQFTTETWAAIGGAGDPASAPEAEQDRRAAQLLASSGPGQWPNCAR